MRRYEVVLRGVVPNVRVYEAETPQQARQQAESEGYRVRLVKPERL